MACFTALEALAVLGRHHALSQNVKVWLVGRQAKHDQVSVRSVNAVSRIRVVALLGALRPDKIKNFMLALTWHKRVGKDDSDTRPKSIGVASLQDVRLERDRESVHELSARRDNIRIEFEASIGVGCLIKIYLVLPVVFDLRLTQLLLLGFLGSAETTRPLLV